MIVDREASRLACTLLQIKSMREQWTASPFAKLHMFWEVDTAQVSVVRARRKELLVVVRTVGPHSVVRCYVRDYRAAIGKLLEKLR